QFAEELDAVDVRHHAVGDHGVEQAAARPAQGVLGAGKGFDLPVLLVAEGARQRLENMFFVIDDQDVVGGHARRPPGCKPDRQGSGLWVPSPTGTLFSLVCVRGSVAAMRGRLSWDRADM